MYALLLLSFPFPFTPYFSLPCHNSPAAPSIFYRILYPHRHTLHKLDMWSVPCGYGKVKAVVSLISCISQALNVCLLVIAHEFALNCSTLECVETKGVELLLYEIHQDNSVSPVCLLANVSELYFLKNAVPSRRHHSMGLCLATPHSESAG